MDGTNKIAIGLLPMDPGGMIRGRFKPRHDFRVAGTGLRESDASGMPKMASLDRLTLIDDGARRSADQRDRKGAPSSSARSARKACAGRPI